MSFVALSPLPDPLHKIIYSIDMGPCAGGWKARDEIAIVRIEDGAVVGRYFGRWRKLKRDPEVSS